MSIAIMTAVWSIKDEDLTPVKRLVLLKFADCAHDDGTRSFPSLDKVSECCGISRSTTTRAIKELCSDGYMRLVTPSRRYCPTTYTVYPDKQGLQVDNPEAERVVTDEAQGCQQALTGLSNEPNYTAPNPNVDKEQRVPNLQVLNHQVQNHQKMVRDERALTDAFKASWDKRYGTAYAFVYPKDGGIAKRLLKALPLEELKVRIPRYLKSEKRFHKECRHSFAVFSASINEWAVEESDGYQSYEQMMEKMRAASEG